jgi:hypothetical protein
MIKSATVMMMGVGAVLWVQPAVAQTSADSAAIVETALDYIDGFYTSDAARMERALHPELAKRIVVTQGGESRLRDMTAEQLVQATSGGGAKQIPEEARREDVSILDIYENVASMRIDAGPWIDYLHVARWNGDWKIVNVLWEMAPRD